MKKSQEYKAERLALVEKADGIFADAEKEQRELTPEERAEIDRITDEESGELARLEKLEVQAEKDEAAIEKWRKELLEAKKPQQKSVSVIKDADKAEAEPRITLKGRSKTFQNDRDAYLSGCWLQLAVGHTTPGNPDPRAELNRFGWGEYATMTEGVGSKGGYFVPDPMVNEIIRNRDTVGVATQLARVVSMGSETLTLFEETGQQTVYYPGEGGSITASDAAFEQHILAVKKRAAMTKVSPELLADAPMSAADIVVNSMSYKFAYQMDNEFINGDGTGTYGGEEGLLNQLLAGQTETADANENELSELDLEDWDGAIAELPGKYLAGNPSWLMSREVWAGSCLTLSATAGGAPVRDVQNGLSGFTWRGYPVAFSDLMPAAADSTVVALFGDWSRGVTIGDRGDMTLATSTDSDFANDLIAIRMTHRYDILVHNSSVYAALKTNAA